MSGARASTVHSQLRRTAQIETRKQVGQKRAKKVNAFGGMPNNAKRLVHTNACIGIDHVEEHCIEGEFPDMSAEGRRPLLCCSFFGPSCMPGLRHDACKSSASALLCQEVPAWTKSCRNQCVEVKLNRLPTHNIDWKTFGKP